jgi:hypothetical protein
MTGRFVTGVLVAVGLAAPAPAQIAVILSSGPAGGGATATATYTASPDVTAIALSELVTLNLNPLNASLVSLFLDGTETPAPSGAVAPALALPPGSALYAGGPPPGAFGSPGIGSPSGGGGGGAGGGGGGGGGGSPLLGVKVKVPENGTPGDVTFAATDPATGNVLGGGWVPFPDGGWWAIEVTDPASLTPTPIGGKTPAPTGGTPAPGPGGSANTPEPATAVLACLGGVVAVIARRRRPSGSTPSTPSRPA